MASLIQLVNGKFAKIFGSKQKKWEDIEYFPDSWKGRIKQMAEYIPAGSKLVMDIGCGKMWLKDYLPVNCDYYGVDYTYRGEGSHVFDLNKSEFPELKADVIFVSGCLEYINDYNWAIGRFSAGCKRCIISYCTLENFPDLAERRKLTWVNDLKQTELIRLFTDHGMELKETIPTIGKNNFYIFENK